MKTILGLFLVLGLTQAMPIKESQDQTHLSQVQLEDLIWSLEAISMIGQTYMKNWAKPKSRVMNKTPRLNLPRPSKPFYPFEIRNDMKDLKKEWNNFEYYKGFGPVTSRPFNYLDLRIIG